MKNKIEIKKKKTVSFLGVKFYNAVICLKSFCKNLLFTSLILPGETLITHHCGKWDGSRCMIIYGNEIDHKSCSANQERKQHCTQHHLFYPLSPCGKTVYVHVASLISPKA